MKELILKIQEWYRYILSKWYILCFLGIIGGAIGLLYALFKKPMYTATTTFVLESSDQVGSGLGQYAGMAAMMGIDLGGSGGGIFQGDNLLELYKSRKMIESTLLLPSPTDSTKLLIDRYLELTKKKEQWEKKKSKLLRINFAESTPKELQRDRDSILQKAFIDINENFLTLVKIDKKSSITKVDFKSEDEIFAKEFNDALVDEVNHFYVQTKTKKSLDNIEILQHKTDSVRAVMNNNIATAAIVIDATPNLNPTKQAKRIVPSQRSQFSAETNKAILSQLVQNLEMSKMNFMKETPLIQILDEPVYPLNIDKISKIKAMIIAGFLFIIFGLIGLTVKRILVTILK